MTHAEKLREAERALVESEVKERQRWLDARSLNPDPERSLVDRVLALRAATCGTCGGTGEVRKVSAGFQWIGHETMEPCPAGCKEGAKPPEVSGMSPKHPSWGRNGL